MTTSMFASYVDRMPRVAAQRVLDAARAMLAPYQPESWWNSLTEQAYGDDEVPVETRRRSPLSINGQPMSIGEAKERLAGALGAGFSDTRAA